MPTGYHRRLVTPDEPLSPALAALERCTEAAVTLDARCCEPGRSPRLAALRGTLAQAMAMVESGGPASATLDLLEDAGARVGRLQVGCCAPDRLPLYARILDDLTTAGRCVSGAAGLGH